MDKNEEEKHPEKIEPIVPQLASPCIHAEAKLPQHASACIHAEAKPNMLRHIQRQLHEEAYAEAKSRLQIDSLSESNFSKNISIARK